MASVSGYIVAAANDSSGGSYSWTGLSSLVARTAPAQANPGTGGTTYYLEGFVDSTLGLPAGATVVGIEWTINWYSTNATNCTCPAAYLVGGGSSRTSPNNRAPGGNLPASLAPVTMGGPTDLWGGNSAAIVTSLATGAFGIAINAALGFTGGASFVNVADLSVTLTYTLAFVPAGGATVAGIGPPLRLEADGPAGLAPVGFLFAPVPYPGDPTAGTPFDFAAGAFAATPAQPSAALISGAAVTLADGSAGVRYTLSVDVATPAAWPDTAPGGPYYTFLAVDPGNDSGWAPTSFGMRGGQLVPLLPGPSGGANIAGTAAPVTGTAGTASGGATISGTPRPVPSGGVAVSGLAPGVSSGPGAGTTGGAVVAGAAAFGSLSTAPAPSGGTAIAGTAAPATAGGPEVSGGVAVSGSSVPVVPPPSAAGGPVIAGIAAVGSIAVGPAPAGGIAVAGTAPPTQMAPGPAPTGGIAVAGSAAPTTRMPAPPGIEIAMPLKGTITFGLQSVITAPGGTPPAGAIEFYDDQIPPVGRSLTLTEGDATFNADAHWGQPVALAGGAVTTLDLTAMPLKPPGVVVAFGHVKVLAIFNPGPGSLFLVGGANVWLAPWPKYAAIAPSASDQLVEIPPGWWEITKGPGVGWATAPTSRLVSISNPNAALAGAVAAIGTVG